MVSRIIGLVALSLLLMGFRIMADDSRLHFDLHNFDIHEVPVHAIILLNSPLILDSRGEVSFSRAHIPGSILFSHDNWDEGIQSFLAAWSPERPILIYCNGNGYDTSRLIAIRLLTDLPDARIYVLKGGFPLWERHQGMAVP